MRLSSFCPVTCPPFRKFVARRRDAIQQMGNSDTRTANSFFLWPEGESAPRRVPRRVGTCRYCTRLYAFYRKNKKRSCHPKVLKKLLLIRCSLFVGTGFRGDFVRNQAFSAAPRSPTRSSFVIRVRTSPLLPALRPGSRLDRAATIEQVACQTETKYMYIT